MRVSKTNICLSISTLPIFLAVVWGNAVRTVVYRDGNTGDPLSSLEDIPPRQEWFRVRGQGSQKLQNKGVNANPRSFTQQRAHAIEDGERDVVVLPREPLAAATSRTRSNKADYEDMPNEQVQIAEPGTGRTGTMQVGVNHRGRVGFQSNRGIKESERGDIYAPDEEWDGMSRVPPLSRLPSLQKGQRQQNWHLHIRHENGHQRERENIGLSDNSEIHSRQGEEVDRRSQPRVNNERRDSDGDYDSTEHNSAQSVNRPDNSNRIVEARPVTHSNDIISSERQDASDHNDSPPPHELVAKMARYIVHNSNWTSLATISTMSPVRGYPFVNIFSLSDGPANNSSGIPYLYLTPLDISVTDLESDSRTSLTMSLAQSDYCRQQQYDPEDPRCAHVILSGSIQPITQKDEITFARNAMFSKHPDMTAWPKDHGWFFAKLDIKNIVVLDYFGGAKTVNLDDYFNQTLL
ncbi:unnamed protein product [Orchesella dallaii]|uniref:CREG-like beta-barrel domain-containing protein n=1 Tax=Orchesella dallaii TaxID=48710 RepID=A0ABP1S2S2_9HEXA